MQQQFTGQIPPYQFQQTSYNMMPFHQTTINRTQTTTNTKKKTPRMSQKQQTTLGNNPQMKKIKATTIPLQGLSVYHHISGRLLYSRHLLRTNLLITPYNRE
jgi:hypothetical protein